MILNIIGRQPDISFVTLHTMLSAMLSTMLSAMLSAKSTMLSAMLSAILSAMLSEKLSAYWSSNLRDESQNIIKSVQLLVKRMECARNAHAVFASLLRGKRARFFVSSFEIILFIKDSCTNTSMSVYCDL